MAFIIAEALAAADTRDAMDAAMSALRETARQGRAHTHTHVAVLTRAVLCVLSLCGVQERLAAAIPNPCASPPCVAPCVPR